jgi:hypothetical protein
MIKQKGLDTIAGGDCLSACTLVVLAGGHRSIAAGGRLGFHQAAFPGASAADLLQMNAVQKTTLEGAGIASGFVERALNTPSSSIWVPTEDEMFEAGFLNTVNPQRIVAEIRDVAASLNATLPKRLDNFTSLAAVNADGSTLHFRYRVGLPQGQFVTEAGKSALYRQNRLSLCNKPANARMIAAGARFAYEYLDDAAKPLFAYTVSDCR